MSVSVVKDKGVTVITVTSDTDSMLPPVCQVFKGLCYSPMLCSVKKGLMQSNAVSALAAVQIMVGLFNIGLAPGRISHHPGDFAHLGVAYWLGGVFVFAGVVSVFADQFSSLCLVGFAAFVNIVGAILSIVGIVMYAVDLGDHSIENMCDWGVERRSYRDDDNCRFVAYVGQRLVTAIDITMIVMATLLLAICISLTVLSIKALINRNKIKGSKDMDIYQPLTSSDA